MSKNELEFIDCETAFGWQPVPGETKGVVEKILSRDPETGDYTGFSGFRPVLRGRRFSPIRSGRRSTSSMDGSLTFERDRSFRKGIMPAGPRAWSTAPTKRRRAA